MLYYTCGTSVARVIGVVAKLQPVALVALRNETNHRRLTLATDHAPTAKSRPALVVGMVVWGTRLVLAFTLRGRVVDLEERGGPQAGEHGSHWGAVGRVFIQGSRTVEVRAGPKAREVDGARAESTQPARVALWREMATHAL